MIHIYIYICICVYIYIYVCNIIIYIYIRNVLKGITWQRSTTSQRIGPGPNAVAPRLTHIAMTISGRRAGGMQPGRVYPPPSTETEVRSNLTRKTLTKNISAIQKKARYWGMSSICMLCNDRSPWIHIFVCIMCLFLSVHRCCTLRPLLSEFLAKTAALTMHNLLQCGRCTRSDSRTSKWTDLRLIGQL